MMRKMGTIHLYRTLTLVMAFREEAISPPQKVFFFNIFPRHRIFVKKIRFSLKNEKSLRNPIVSRDICTLVIPLRLFCEYHLQTCYRTPFQMNEFNKIINNLILYFSSSIHRFFEENL